MNIKNLGLALALSIQCLTGWSQDVVFDNYYLASRILDSTILAYEQSGPLSAGLQVNVKGTESFFGHYSVPEKSLTVPLDGTLQFHQNIFLSKFQVAESGKTYTSANLVTGDSTYWQDYGDNSIQKIAGTTPPQQYFYSPRILLLEVLSNRETLHLVSTSATAYYLGFNTKTGKKYYLTIDRQSFLITKLQSLFYDNVYGDSSEEISYLNYDKDRNPTQIIDKKSGLTLRDVTLQDPTSNFVIDTTAIKLLRKSKIEIAGKKNTSTPFELAKIQNGLSILKLNEIDNKILIAELEDGLAVFEAPVSVEICRKAIEFLKSRYPQKKIKYCFLSHHHPDHAGGFLAFAEEGATIVTTKTTEEYLSKLAAKKHSISLDRTNTFTKPRFDIIQENSKLEYFNKKNSLVVYESGATSEHTSEYLFFYFPASKVFFVGDLVMFPAECVWQQGKRARAVYDVIQKNKLSVDRIYTSWPLHQQKEYGTAQDLTNSLTQVYPELKAAK